VKGQGWFRGVVVVCKMAVGHGNDGLVWRLIVGAAGSGVSNSSSKVDWLGAGNRKWCVCQGVQGKAVCWIQMVWMLAV